MAQRKTLSQAQLDLLQWVDEGCPGGVYEGFDHRISAAALRRRGLVQTSGHGGKWEVRITAAGREYLRTSKEPGAAPPRQANISVTEKLVRDVQAAGGVLRLKQERGPGSVDWEGRVRATIQLGRVPAGKRLICRRRDDECEIRLEDLAPGLEPRPMGVPVPERVARYHPVVKRFRRDAEHLEVSRAQLGRASRILQALVTAAGRRGWVVANVRAAKGAQPSTRAWTAARRGHLLVSVGDFSQAVRIREEGLPSRARWRGKLLDSRFRAGETHKEPIDEYEEKATGRLVINLVPSFGGRMWADRKSWTLEEKLPEVIQEIEISAEVDLHRREEAERAGERRRHEWEAAMTAAERRYLDAWRADRLIRRVESWRQVEEIKAYCDAVEARYPPDRNPKAADWIGWARCHIERIDPLAKEPSMPADPENVRGEDLRPYLGHWSPYRPEDRR